MKALYLTLSIIFTTLILILAFGNIGAICNNVNFLFFPVRMNTTSLSLIVAVLGMITGACYHAFIVRVLATSDEEDEADFE